MAVLTVAHDYDCSAETFFRKCVLSRAYNEELYRSLGFPKFEWLELKDEGAKVHRKIRVQPTTGNLPAPIQKIVGEGISYVEEGTFDAATLRFDFRVLPSALGDKADVTGSLWCTDRPGGVVRHARFDARIKVFGIGSLIEDKMLENYKRSFDAAAAFTKGYLQREGLLAG